MFVSINLYANVFAWIGNLFENFHHEPNKLAQMYPVAGIFFLQIILCDNWGKLYPQVGKKRN